MTWASALMFDRPVAPYRCSDSKVRVSAYASCTLNTSFFLKSQRVVRAPAVDCWPLSREVTGRALNGRIHPQP